MVPGGGNGDEVFEAFVAARYPALCRLAYALCGDWYHAEDAVQTTLATVYEAYRRGRVADLDPAVRRALMTTLAGWRRRRRRRGEWSTAELPDDAVPDDDGTATVELRCALLAALGRLPVGQRAVLALRFLEDLSERETAEALGVSAGTVKSRTSRALASLRGVEGLRELVATVDAPAETSVSPLTPVTPERRTRWPAVAEGQG